MTGAKVELGGKRRTLRYTMPALNRLENERRGEGVADTLTAAAQLHTSAITALIWAGLLHEDPTLEPSGAAELIEPPFEAILDAITQALTPWLKANTEEPEGKAVVAA
jgi:hypothetical protein